MTIKITGKHILIAGAIAVGAYVIYKVAKAEAEEAKKTDDLREAILESTDFDDDLQVAAWQNEAFDADERSDAAIILTDLQDKIMKARTVDDLNKADSRYKNVFLLFTDPETSKAEKIARLYFEIEKFRKKEKEESEKKAQEENAKNFSKLAGSIDRVARKIDTGNISAKDFSDAATAINLFIR